jgi:hypothetical protein
MAAVTPTPMAITTISDTSAAVATPRRRGPGRASASSAASSADVLADALVVSQQAGPPDCPKTFSDGLCVCVLKFLHPSVAFDHAFFAGLPKAVGEILTVPEIARVRAHFCDGDLGEAYRVLMTNGLDGRTKKLQTALLAYIAKQLRSKAENAAIKKAKDEAAELKQSRKREREEEEKKVQEDTEDEIERVTLLCEATIATLNAAYLSISLTDWAFHNVDDKHEACSACATAMTLYAQDTVSAICFDSCMEPRQTLLLAVLNLGRKAPYLGQSLIEFCQRFNDSGVRIDVASDRFGARAAADVQTPIMHTSSEGQPKRRRGRRSAANGFVANVSGALTPANLKYNITKKYVRMLHAAYSLVQMRIACLLQ